MQQLVVMVGNISVQLLNITNLPIESGEWNVTVDFLLPQLSLGNYSMVIRNSVYGDTLITAIVQTTSLSSPFIKRVVPSSIPVQGATVEVQVLLLLLELPTALLTYDSNCGSVPLPVTLIRYDTSRYATIQLQFPPLLCQGPAKLLFVNKDMGHSQSSVFVYDPQSISVVGISPSLVSSAGGTIVTLSMHCGISSYCNGNTVGGLSMYLKLDSIVVSKCLSVVLLEQKFLLKCMFAAPAVAVETSSRKLVEMDLIIPNITNFKTLKVQLFVIRRMPRVIVCNISSSSIAFLTANGFAAVTFQYLSWNPSFRAELQLPSNKIVRLTTIAQRSQSADTTLINFMLPSIAAGESGKAAFIFESFGAQEVTFSWPIWIFSSASLSIVRVSPDALSSKSMGDQFLKLVIFGPALQSTVSLMHLPSLTIPILVNSDCDNPVSDVGFNVLPGECRSIVVSIPPGSLENVTNVTLVATAGSLKASFRMPVTSEIFAITQISPASIFDCNVRNILLNISFTSSKILILSELTVMVGSVPASIVGIHSDGTKNSVVVGPLTTATAGSLVVSLTLITNSSTVKSSANLQVASCCEDIVSFCKLLGTIAVPQAGVDVSFGTRTSGGCDSSVCQQSSSVPRAAIIDSSAFVLEDGGLLYFVIRNFPSRSSADIAIGALNQLISISVDSAFLLSANIVNITARTSAFSRTGPTLSLELRSPFALDYVRVTLNVIPSFKGNPIILSVLPSIITEYAAVPIVVVLTNFPPIQNASNAFWSLTHPSRTINGTASILTYSSLSGDAQFTIQLPYDTRVAMLSLF